MTRTAQRLKAKNKKYRNEPNFPSNPMKGNPLAIQPSNPRATGGFGEPPPQARFLSAFICVHRRLKSSSYFRIEREPATTRTGAAPRSQKQEIPKRTQFPLESHEKNPACHPAVEPTRDRGFRQPATVQPPLQSQKPNAPNEPNFRPNPMKSKPAYGPSPRRSSTPKRSSGHYLPPGNGPSHRPNRPIPRPLIAITDISRLACAISSPLWGRPLAQAGLPRKDAILSATIGSIIY